MKTYPHSNSQTFSFKWPFENTVIWPSVHPSLLDFGGFVLRLHHQSGAKKEDNPISFWLPTLLSFFWVLKGKKRPWLKLSLWASWFYGQLRYLLHMIICIRLLKLLRLFVYTNIIKYPSNPSWYHNITME